ncbi:bifunctional UDP-N-acetylglucosamine diphosphorylase/glucosamine-1-phosphate N-acetyltransferase GlmU [Rhodospirillaceae bacterium KN72]|uniref:Bifunctional protein GlmU n=1 Tax=Pacificispira spongiicola TaxID=2729598 RepID=A0A7Y0HG39_9PROT|nr:bifunctional UDP-N-acetylglucosamine diphosphorylase/glucosamine-1-phosphate N-acetyltransferase GlmU [Pacificispira spongiicola]NMM46520.1 bifunctional UDP-N-acetylglucosamine diphosphorylase/glucosamine-1-phosphate N-acetyltransferase GlmU [Pacificispira spongiicola]
MPKQPVAAVILAAGMGTRMKSDLPKVLHEVGGKPLVGHALASVQGLDPQRIAVVVGPETDAVAKAVAPVPTTVQVDRLGTADALKQARDLLVGFDEGTVVVSFGDSPFIRTETVARMVAAREEGAHVVVLGFEPEDPAAYGRLVTDADGGLEAIVEFKDADAATRAIRLCNSGVMAISAAHLFALVDRIGNDNAKGEYYLTDIVAVARGDGLTCRYILAEESELMGINSRTDLAAAEAFWQDRARRAAMDGGATLRDPASTFFSWDTVLGRDVVVEPNVVFGPGVTVEDGVTIKAFSHFEGCILRAGATVGPFARIRPGADIGEGAKIGNFVEVKNAVFAKGAKANHLSYIGDADVGAAANIGAGTITCNYDGYLKHRTKIGEEAFIGSNSSLVAPVSIGDRANVGAGSTITKDVAADALAVARGEQRVLEGVAAKLRARLKAAKAALKKS